MSLCLVGETTNEFRYSAKSVTPPLIQFCHRDAEGDARVCRRSGVADEADPRNSEDDAGIKRVCRRSGVADGTETRNSEVDEGDARVCEFSCLFPFANLSLQITYFSKLFCLLCRLHSFTDRLRIRHRLSYKLKKNMFIL